MIKSYEDFRDKLMAVGFSLLSGGGAGEQFALLPGTWTDEPAAGSPIRWHTGDPDTDPWQWRKRITADAHSGSPDVGYAKLFFGKAGYVTREWAPRFMAVRQRGLSLDGAYAAGLITEPAKHLYAMITERGEMSAYALRKQVKHDSEWNSAHDRAVTELQMKMYITIAREEQEITNGRAHGWPSSVYTTSESYWGGALIREAAGIDRDQARADIEAQVKKHFPGVDEKTLKRFIAE